MNYETKSHKTHHETLKSQENLLPLQTKDVQAMLPLSEKCQECIFHQSGDLNFKKLPLGGHHESTSRRLLTKQTAKKLNLCRKTAVDKCAWIKAWK